jgi:hypothetical protein
MTGFELGSSVPEAGAITTDVATMNHGEWSFTYGK